ncbi:amidase domain-containing protein [Streptomyces abikoensis]|uniref:amidase domain-containing protein n=1 Tax=Streptomyces abikoensis TaxID=97398 RepID=UPI0033C29735
MRKIAPGLPCALLTAAVLTLTTAVSASAAGPSASPPDSRSAEESRPLAAADVQDLTGIARAYLRQRADSVTLAGAKRLAPVTPERATPALKQSLAKEFAQLAEQGRAYEKASGGYSRAEVAVTPGKAEQKGDRATLRLTETTSLLYPNVRSADEPKAEEYTLDHTLTFTRDAAGAWVLASDRPDIGTGDVTTYNTPPRTEQPTGDAGDTGGTKNEGPRPAASGTERPPAGTPADEKAKTGKSALAAGYDYTAMVNYANRYWQHPNGAYRTYGNDCTNFVSQAMKAGGWKKKGSGFFDRKDRDKWYYGDHTWTTSYTWGGAENWFWFARKYSQRAKPLSNVWQMALGDVLQADWDRDNTIDHTMIVTGFSGTSEIYLTYHTSNTHNRKLTNLLAKYPHAWWYAHRT